MGGQNSSDDIVVAAWSQRYAQAFNRLIGIEGGDANDPVDHGGATRFGISLRFLASEGRIDLDDDGRADFDLDMDGDIDGADIAKLTIANARFLYQRCFWVPLDCERWAAPIGEAMFDQGVNGGLVAARKLLQRAINRCLDLPAPTGADGHHDDLEIDGVLGEKSRAAFDWVDQWFGVPALINAYRIVAAQRYRAIVAADPSQAKWLNGWLNRAAALGRF